MSAMCSRTLRYLSLAEWTTNTTFLVISDHRCERVSLELEVLIAVAKASGQLVIAVLEVVQDGPTLPHYVHRPVLPIKKYFIQAMQSSSSFGGLCNSFFSSSNLDLQVTQVSCECKNMFLI